MVRTGWEVNPWSTRTEAMARCYPNPPNVTYLPKKMLKGNLADLPLPELLQTLATSSQGGLLALKVPGLEGRVGFRAQRIVFARAGGLEGLDALLLLAGLREGPFVFGPADLEEENLKAPLTEVLTALLEATEVWRSLTAIPEDWSRVLKKSGPRQEFELALPELQLYSEAEDRTVAEVLAVPGEVLARARTLNRLLARGVLVARVARSIAPVTLVALPYYGPVTGLAYVDRELYQRWSERLGGPFRLRVRAPRGGEATFRVEPRDAIPERVMLHDRELRKLRAARGTRLKVVPEVEDGSIKP